MPVNQKGVAHILILVAAVGLVAFLIASSTASFKNGLFARLFPREFGFASGPISGPIESPSPTPLPTPTPDTESPTVNITSPVSGATVRKNSTVTISATASDNVGIAKVEFYVNNVLSCTDLTAPYSCSWRVPKAPRVIYNLTAKAYDLTGNSASKSIQVTSK